MQKFFRDIFLGLCCTIMIFLFPSTEVKAQETTNTFRPSFSFVKSSVSLRPGASNGGGILTIRVPTGTPKVRELGDGNAEVTLGDPVEFGDSSANEWNIPIYVKNLEFNTSETRYLQVTAGGKASSLSYTLTNTPTSPFSWDIHSPSGSIAWSSESYLVAYIDVGPVPARNISIDGYLVDKSSSKQFGEGWFELCATPPTAKCDDIGEELSANESHKIYLRLAPNSDIYPGSYEGKLRFFSANAKTIESPVTIHYSTRMHKIWGGLVVSIGVLGALGFTIFVRNGLTSAQLLAPATVLKDKFVSTTKELSNIEPENWSAVATRKLLKIWDDRLDIAYLRSAGLVPGRWSVATPSNESVQTYQQFLTEAGSFATILNSIVFRGFRIVATTWRKMRLTSGNEISDQESNSVKKAWDALDDLSAGLEGELSGTLDDVEMKNIEASINQILNDMRSSLQNTKARVAMPSRRRHTKSERERLQYHISVLSMASWALVAFLTILVGVYVMVIGKDGFGSFDDYLLAFLWGFGLPAVGGQLSQSSPALISKSLGVTLPKS